MLELSSIEKWDESFFDLYREFRNEIHRDIVTSFPVKAEDYSKFFREGTLFANFKWKAFQVKKSGQILAQGILSLQEGRQSASLGFIDWVNDFEAAQILMNQVILTARSWRVRSIKTPVDLNFFVKYRIRSGGPGRPFYGEPIYPDYYHDLFRATGFKVIGKWDSYGVKKFEGTLDFFRKRKKLSHKVDQVRLRTQIRCVRLSDWENELRIIFDLFTQAYKEMPEFEELNFEQFKLIYDDFKYIIHPWYSYIVELEGKPVGFSINFVDPLQILSRVKGRSLNQLQKIILLLKLRLNNGTYLISHIGRIPGPQGEEIKGIQIQVSRRIAIACFFMRAVLVTFQNESSPSRRTWSPEVRKEHSHYVLYGMDLK